MINKIIDEAIRNKGITVVFLSRETGIPYDAIAKIRKGKREVRAEEFIRLCLALDIDIDLVARKITS